MSKSLFGSSAVPMCVYCAHSQKTMAKTKLLCPKQGPVDPKSYCKKFAYDPLKRVPARKAHAPEPLKPIFEPEKFLED